MSKVKIAFVGSLAFIVLLGVSSIWLFTMITTLQANNNILTSQIQTLQNQVDTLSNQLDQKNSQINTLNQNYTELLSRYEDLLFHYNLLNHPASSNFTKYTDLEIQFSLDYTTYYYQDPVSGNITINYLNGTAFKGRVGINFHLYGMGAKGFWVNIEGFVRFNLSPPVFQYGPGTYKVTIWSLVTPDGYSISIPEASRPWLQVEAK